MIKTIVKAKGWTPDFSRYDYKFVEIDGIEYPLYQKNDNIYGHDPNYLTPAYASIGSIVFVEIVNCNAIVINSPENDSFSGELIKENLTC